MLPKITAPLNNHTIFSSKQKITYRPFLVKEEKILLMALETQDSSAMLQAIKQIIKNCVVEDIDVETLPMFDIELLFIKLRSKSADELIEMNINPTKCSKNKGGDCPNKTKVSINLNDIELKVFEDHTKKIQLTDDVGVIMKYPSLKFYEEFIQTSESNDKNSKINISETSTNFQLIIDSIESIYDAEDIYDSADYKQEELEAFLDSLTTQQFKPIKRFFDTLPSVSHTENFKCPHCSENKVITLEGLESFFLLA